MLNRILKSMVKRYTLNKLSRYLATGLQLSLPCTALIALLVTSQAEASKYGVSEAQIERMRKDAFLKIEKAYNFTLSAQYQEIRPYLRNEAFVRTAIGLSMVATLGLPTGRAIVSATPDDRHCGNLNAAAYIPPVDGVIQMPMVICLDYPGGEPIIHEWLLFFQFKLREITCGKRASVLFNRSHI